MPMNDNVNLGICVALGFTELYYCAAGYAYATFNENGPKDSDVENTALLIGTGSLIMLICFIIEMVLGLANFDDNKIWGFAFIIGTVSAIACTIAAGFTNNNSISSADGNPFDDDDYRYYMFALITAPVAYRTLIVFLKYRDIALAKSGAQ